MSIDLEAISARAEAATPGPWETLDNITTAVWSGGNPIALTYQSMPDADFIAHAREDIPALLAEVKRLNIVLQDERKEHAEEYACLRSTYIRESKKLEKQLASVTAERDAAVEMMRGNCEYCKHFLGSFETSEKCSACKNEHVITYKPRKADNWEWCGAGKERSGENG